MESPIRIGWIGPGAVGSHALDTLTSNLSDLQVGLGGRPIRLAGIVGSKKMFLTPNGSAPEVWRTGYSKCRLQPAVLELLGALLRAQGIRILVDTSSAPGFAALYREALSGGIHVVTANKGSVVKDFSTFDQLRRTAKLADVRFLYGTCVGAALRCADMVREHVVAGDPISAIGGVLGGTPSFLMNSFMEQDRPFSAIVQEAIDLGYTDPPDPRLDLSGRDVANKLRILNWVKGNPDPLDQIQVDPILQLPDGAMAPEQVMSLIIGLDETMKRRKEEALNEGRRLRYVFSIRDQQTSVGLRAVDQADPAYDLKGPENLVWVTSRAHPTPRSIRGFGAGPAWTGMGVYWDILTILGLL